MKAVVDFIYEVGMLNHTPRSGLWFLGSGKQSVAEHLLRTAYITYCLSEIIPKVNKEKAILMALVHDLGEARTSDLNYVHQRYGRLSEADALRDMAKEFPFGGKINDLYVEEQGKVSLESKVVRDADQLEWIATLREEEVKGNAKARVWAKIALQRLQLPITKRLGAVMMKTHPDNWWFHEKDKWFVARNPKHRTWKSHKR